MVNEVNKIIRNMILSGSEVCIDGIGTLFTLRIAAQRSSRKRVVPPYRIISFVTEQRGASLKEEIARVAEVDSAKANEIFEHWLSESLVGETLTIDGVGTLHHDNFKMDDEFATALNPQGQHPLRLKPKANVGLYIFASLCMVFALAVAGYVYVDSHDIDLTKLITLPTKTADVAQNNVTKPTAEVTEVTATADSTAMVAPAEVEVAVATAEVNDIPTPQASENIAVEVKTSTATTNTTGDVQPTIPGRSYVVLGVFSTPENVARAIRQAQKSASDLQYSVYEYGSKYMVAVYDTESRSECQEFVRSLDGKFKDLWVYSRK